MININIDVAPTVLVLGILVVVACVLFFRSETAYKRLLQLLKVVVKALDALSKLFYK